MIGLGSARPLEHWVAERWLRLDAALKWSFLAVVVISLLAFGFEMTNLSLHHDDVVHIFIQDTILGHYLGRFGTGWLHYYTQGAHIMPFLQMAEGIVVMAVYGLLVAHFWGLRKTLDLTLVAAVMCVFPYMAQIYQYNSAMATYSVAHLLVALAVFWSARATAWYVLAAAAAYFAAFSIYQSIISNAAAILGVWLLSRAVFGRDGNGLLSRVTLRAVIAAALAVAIGGLLYVAAVKQMDLRFDAYQDAGDAFSFKKGLQLSLAVPAILQGTKSFFFYPESYFPVFLKNLQLLFLLAAAAVCIGLPKRWLSKIVALAVLLLCLFTPRLLQLLHPAGTYHNLTLTAYAVVVAGCLMVVFRSEWMRLRNTSALLACLLVGGYLIQSNWISTVGLLNSYAHTTTLNQIIGRVWALPAEQWKGGEVVVVGRYDMPDGYPFKSAVGVATEFIDAPHMQKLAALMRTDINFVPWNKDSMPAVARFAATHPVWPHPDSVGVVDGMAVVLLSKPE
jgi:hypothetical protein